MSPSLSLTDSFGRRIDYLRISVTERCDLRCAYCRPHPSRNPSPGDLLAADDIITLARAAVQLGLHRIRLTGGEPLLRDDLEQILTRLRALPGLRDLALTTNGQTLARRADALAAAGLRRVNISLDSLDPQVYAALTGGGDLAAVRRGLDAALAAGLSPVKLNVVLASAAALQRAALPAFLDLIQRRPVHVRFIEAMPTCSHLGYLPAQDLLDYISRRHQLTPVPGPDGGGPARYYRLNGSPGTIGIIAPISQPFCSHCNRLRISARGQLIPCLFSPTGSAPAGTLPGPSPAAAFDLLPALRSADPSSDIKHLLMQAVAAKPKRYRDVAEPSGITAMHVIGG